MTFRSTSAWTAALAVLVVSATGCSESDHVSSSIIVRDSAGVQIVANDLSNSAGTCPVSEDAVLTIGAAEGRPEYELYRVFGAGRLSNGRIVIVNEGSQELRFYDADGTYLMSAGGAGGGPGEFRNAFYLWIQPGDTIWVGDYSPWRFLVFDPNGHWIRTVEPKPEYLNPPSAMGVLDDGRFVLGAGDLELHPAPEFTLRELTAVIHASTGRLLDTVAAYPNGRYGRLTSERNAPFLYPLFESFADLAAAGSKIVIGHGAQAEVRVFSAIPTVHLERIVRWSAGSQAITAQDVATERRAIAAKYTSLSQSVRRVMVDPLLSEDRPVADELPAFTALMLGRDGRIWIKEYARPAEVESPPVWIAFDANGRFQCRATLPRVIEVLEFGPDYVLAKTRDDLDVEHVVMHSIRASR